MDALLAHCAGFFSGNGGMFAVFFLGGLTGSLTHCLAMCGPVVACQSACGGCGSSNALQWRYHAGRFITYGALGFCAALIGGQVAALPFWPVVSAMLLLVAGVMFIVSSVTPHRLDSGCKPQRQDRDALLRGLLMGFMPCGLLYAALMMAATLGNPLAGMVAMWLFVLGTMPALLCASVGADWMARKWQHVMCRIGRAMMAFNGLSLLVIAARVMR